MIIRASELVRSSKLKIFLDFKFACKNGKSCRFDFDLKSKPLVFWADNFKRDAILLGCYFLRLQSNKKNNAIGLSCLAKSLDLLSLTRGN